MDVRFSSLADRLAGGKNPLYVLHDELRTAGKPLTDLVRGNVNEHGIQYPQDLLVDILRQAAAAAAVYRPDSFGQPVARQAVAEYYRSPFITPDNVLMTPGTSISYWYCFKLLAEEGDEILCPQPSYPLFDYIAKMCGVHLTHYRLVESREWEIDLEHLEHQISTRTRGVVLISPHNPTGMVIGRDQLSGIADIATRHGLPLISDEVFSEFLFGLDELPRASSTHAPLVFTLNGFSKMFAMPGMKIGWTVVTGDNSMVRKSLSSLEMISDTFLPVNELAQFAVPEIFRRGQPFLANYRGWIQQCFEKSMAGMLDLHFTRPRGGFYVTIPTEDEEEQVAQKLLRDHGILTHPGYYYDIKPDHLVMTFIHDPRSLTKSFRRIALSSKLS